MYVLLMIHVHVHVVNGPCTCACTSTCFGCSVFALCCSACQCTCLPACVHNCLPACLCNRLSLFLFHSVLFPSSTHRYRQAQRNSGSFCDPNVCSLCLKKTPHSLHYTNRHNLYLKNTVCITRIGENSLHYSNRYNLYLKKHSLHYLNGYNLYPKNSLHDLNACPLYLKQSA